jgi:hypothetical protein
MLLIDDDGRPAGVLHPEDILSVLNGRRYGKGHA